MATLGEYLGAGASTTKLLLHLSGNSTDSSGNGINGTDTAITYSLANGRFGQGAGFNGSTSLINLGNTLNIAGAITISAWVYPTVNTTPNGIIGRGNGTNGNNNQYVLDIENSAARFYVRNTGNTYYIASKALTLNTWNHIVGTWAGGATPVNVYVNSVLGTPSSNFSGTQMSGSVTYIGNSAQGTTETITGNIDEVIVENRVWTASEIKKYYTMTKGRFATL